MLDQQYNPITPIQKSLSKNIVFSKSQNNQKLNSKKNPTAPRSPLVKNELSEQHIYDMYLYNEIQKRTLTPKYKSKSAKKNTPPQNNKTQRKIKSSNSRKNNKIQSKRRRYAL